MVNARLHMICGNCGQDDMFTWKIEKKGNCDKEGFEYPDVYICCRNCTTLHSLTSKLGDSEDYDCSNVEDQQSVINEFRRFAEQVILDTEGIEREMLSFDGVRSRFSEWSTVANTYRWAKSLLENTKGR